MASMISAFQWLNIFTYCFFPSGSCVRRIYSLFTTVCSWSLLVSNQEPDQSSKHYLVTFLHPKWHCRHSKRRCIARSGADSNNHFWEFCWGKVTPVFSDMFSEENISVREMIFNFFNNHLAVSWSKDQIGVVFCNLGYSGSTVSKWGNFENRPMQW